MMGFLSVLFLVSVYVATSEELQNAPGRVIFWSPAHSVDRAISPEYRTQSMDVSQIKKIFDDSARENEIVAVIKSADGRPVLSHSSVKDSIRVSSSSTVLPNIYHTDVGDAHAEMLSGTDSLKGVKKIDLHSFVQILRDHVESSGSTIGPMNNGHLDSYEISLNGHETEHEHMIAIATLCSKNPNSVLFAAAEEPMKNAVFPSKNGEFSRVLSTASSSNIDGIFYKPEGSEYSIYYADTYLYITPDIFTGLMTGIFVFFVLLTGYSCLGAIQGNSVYPSKMPVLGREA